MFRKAVVVGVDGSSESLRAAGVAWRIADSAGLTLHVVHAVSGAQLSRTVGRTPVYVSGLFAQTLARARKDLVARLRGVVPPAQIRAVDVGTGRAAHVLAERVARRRAGLVVLGGKRHGRLARAFGGSIAHYLVRVLDIPVLVTATPSIRRVLVAVDFSGTTGRTLAAGIALARLLGARVRVLHVVEPIRYTYVVPRAPDYTTVFAEAGAALARLATRLGIPESETVVRRGAPSDLITDEVARWKADLVVVGSHGKGFVDRALIGSTTESLLDRLPSSVLIVPAVRGKGTSRRSRRTR